MAEARRGTADCHVPASDFSTVNGALKLLLSQYSFQQQPEGLRLYDVILDYKTQNSGFPRDRLSSLLYCLPVHGNHVKSLEWLQPSSAMKP